MGAHHYFYPGADYSLEPGLYANSNLPRAYSTHVPVHQIGVATDPRTSNQLDAVSKKLSSGTKTVEISSIQADTLDYTPKQQFQEIARLKKLVGADITFHGPLIDPTGFTREGWDSGKREAAERQIWNAVMRSHDLDPEGNVIVTLHSTSALPEMHTRVITTDEKGEKKEKSTEIWVIDEKTHGIQSVKVQENYLLDQAPDPKFEIERMNKENWEKLLTQVSYHAIQGEHTLRQLKELISKDKTIFPKANEQGLIDLYKEINTSDGQKKLEKAFSPEEQQRVREVLHELNHAEIYLRDSYNELQNIFNRAWISAERQGNKEDIEKLKEFRSNILPKIKKGDFSNPDKLYDMADEILKGVNVLSNLSSSPQLLRPLNEFAVEKASETYGNVAFRSFQEFKDKAPILSIENPPAGGGISRAEDLKKLVQDSRDQFVKRAVQEGMSESDAKRQAEKLIGVTWDVGHINMLRKYGYSEKDVIKETEKIAPFVKHVHLSDNFGLEHTELPMGMGNVPTKEMLDLISKYNKQAKKIIETGGWYQFFQKTPLRETFESLGSPVYSGQGVYWTQIGSLSGGYFAGMGMNPDVHHSIYGGGFSTLPPELGGQLRGGRSRLSGTPME